MAELTKTHLNYKIQGSPAYIKGQERPPGLAKKELDIVSPSIQCDFPWSSEARWISS